MRKSTRETTPCVTLMPLAADRVADRRETVDSISGMPPSASGLVSLKNAGSSTFSSARSQSCAMCSTVAMYFFGSFSFSTVRKRALLTTCAFVISRSLPTTQPVPLPPPICAGQPRHAVVGFLRGIVDAGDAFADFIRLAEDGETRRPKARATARGEGS